MSSVILPPQQRGRISIQWGFLYFVKFPLVTRQVHKVIQVLSQPLIIHLSCLISCPLASFFMMGNALRLGYYQNHNSVHTWLLPHAGPYAGGNALILAGPYPTPQSKLAHLLPQITIRWIHIMRKEKWYNLNKSHPSPALDTKKLRELKQSHKNYKL
jgi:hypothetical protein